MKPRLSILFSICFLTIIIYLPVLQHGFVNWDDDLFILRNPLVQSLTLKSVGQVFTQPVEGRYYPLTMISLGIDAHLFRGHPTGFHAVNLLLHIMNIVGVFVLLTRLRLAEGVVWIATLLFAIHPLQVESVAWISSRKDLLAAMFALLALNLLWVEEGTGRKERSSMNPYYVGALIAFLASLLCKPMALTLPFVIGGYWIWINQLSLARALKRMLPFLIIALMIGGVTIVSANQVWPDLPGIGVVEKVLLSGYALAMYAVKVLAPFGLSAYYPIESIMPLTTAQITEMAIVFVLGLIVFTWVLVRWRQPVVSGGLFAFAVLMAPALHLVKVNASLIYERFIYFPGLGLWIAVGWIGLAVWNQLHQHRARSLMLGLALFAAVGLVFQTHQRTYVWRYSIALWSDAIHRFPDNDFVYLKRANAFIRQGAFSKGVEDLRRSIQLNPHNALAHFNLALVYEKLYRDDLALEHLNAAVKIAPNYQKALQRRDEILNARQKPNP